MECIMDRSCDGVMNTGDRMSSQQKSLTPAILGMPSGSHGAKLSSNMNSKDKEELLLKLEAWRQVRKQKLTATILAKAKKSNDSKLPSHLPRPKLQTISNPPVGIDDKQKKSDGKKSVFDRLYENASRATVKKTEENRNEKFAGAKNMQTFKTSKYPPFGKPKVPKVILMADIDDCSDPPDVTVKDTTSPVSVMENMLLDNEPHNTDSLSKKPPQETILSALVEENVSGKGGSGNEVDAKVDELIKNNEVINFDVKKMVCFETPEEKILSPIYLRDKLEEWLTKNGHSIDTYRHLRCFGLNGEKTPIPCHRQTKMDDFSNSSFYSTAPNTPIAEIIDESDKENIMPPASAPKIDISDVEGWLGDLHRLIVHVKYPNDRCEEWLNAITKKFPDCTQLPIYWECLAAMNGECENFKSIQEIEESENREGEDHETSIAELLDKLVIDGKCQSASKIERGLSVKNIFKSKTVKFALQEKAFKELDPELGIAASRKVLVATPVRRSARLQTPSKSNIVGSLQSLDPETRRSVSFQPNEALLTG